MAGLALLLVLGQAPALAAIINVGGSCTLVRAIVAANNDATAGGNCTKGSGADRIVLPRNSTEILTTANTDYLGPTGLPAIRSNITIACNGSTIRRAGTAPRFRIFAVSHTGNLTLQRCRVTGGSTGGPNPNISYAQSGGGALIYSGILTLTSSTMSGNRARFGGAVAACGSDCTSHVSVTNSTISGNITTSSGPTLYANDLSISNSTISSNTGGGAAAGYNGAINRSTISGNTGHGMSAIATLYGAGLTVTNSTISDNRLAGVSDAIFGVEFIPPYSYGSDVTLRNSTISGNEGTGVSADEAKSDFRLTHTTATRNRDGGVSNFAAAFNLTHTLIAGNTGAAGGTEVFNRGSINSNGFNLFGHRGLTNAQGFENFRPGPTDITATSNGNRPTALAKILNTTLANNGGPTRTHALVAGSPAIDTVTDGTCPPPNQDQRGVRRPHDGNNDGAAICDTGSFERRPRE